MGTVSSTDSIFAAIEVLRVDIRSRGEEIARERRLPADLVVALQRAGVFRMPMPRTWGGPEVSLVDQIRIIEILSAADPAVGWCCMIGSDAGFYSAFFDDDAARELWTDIDDITAGWLFPAGRARRVDGGYSISGRWSFGSCSLHANVIVGGCLAVDDAGVPEFGVGGPVVRIAVARAEQFEILDTWYTTGLAGSGSNDYQCSDLFVPEKHTFSVFEPPVREGALYALRGAFFANMSGVPLGLARRVIDETIAIVRTKLVVPEQTPMIDQPRVKAAVADAEMHLGAARAYAYGAVETVSAALEAGVPVTQQMRADLVLSRVNAFRTARAVAMQRVQLAGTQAIYSTSVLDRLLRDAITIGQHVVAGPAMVEIAGGLAMGIEPTGMMAGLV